MLCRPTGWMVTLYTTKTSTMYVLPKNRTDGLPRCLFPLLRHARPHDTTRYHTIPHYTALYHTIPHYTTRYHTTRYHTLSCWYWYYHCMQPEGHRTTTTTHSNQYACRPFQQYRYLDQPRNHGLATPQLVLAKLTLIPPLSLQGPRQHRRNLIHQKCPRRHTPPPPNHPPPCPL